MNTIEASCRKFGPAEVFPLDDNGGYGVQRFKHHSNMSTENPKKEDVGIRITVEFT